MKNRGPKTLRIAQNVSQVCEATIDPDNETTGERPPLAPGAGGGEGGEGGGKGEGRGGGTRRSSEDLRDSPEPNPTGDTPTKETTSGGSGSTYSQRKIPQDSASMAGSFFTPPYGQRELRGMAEYSRNWQKTTPRLQRLLEVSMLEPRVRSDTHTMVWEWLPRRSASLSTLGPSCTPSTRNRWGCPGSLCLREVWKGGREAHFASSVLGETKPLRAPMMPKTGPRAGRVRLRSLEPLSLLERPLC